MISLLSADTDLQASLAAKDKERERWAVYCGYQEGFMAIPGFHLWTLIFTLGEKYPAGTTIAEQTLDGLIGL